MICNYSNINDLCFNQYSYSFYNVIPNGTSVIVDKSESAPVLRTDKVTGQTKIINQFSQNLIPTCDSSDDNENITEWECYLIYRYLSSGIVNDPPLQTFKNAQIDIINNSYNTTITDGILVNINNQNVVLGASINDQIAYKSILSYAQVLYDDDIDAAMPSFSDKYGKIYSLSYDNLISVFITYLEKIIYYKNLRDTLITKCNSATSIDDIQTLNWCNTKPIDGVLKTTTISTALNNKPSVQTCVKIEVNNDCDPPCDPEGCEDCIAGNCINLCSPTEYCNNGVCENNTCSQPNPACGWHPYEANPGQWQWQWQSCYSETCCCDGLSIGSSPSYSAQSASPVTSICIPCG